MRRLRIILVLALSLAAAPAAAQQRPVPQDSGVLVVDQERLFSESRFGARVTEEIERRTTEIAAENREIEAELIEEERALTERRDELPPEEFGELADAFDAKVQRLRAQQDQKARELSEWREAARGAFAERIVPILSELVRDRGGLVLLERRQVFLSAEAIDITDAAIERLDAAVDRGELSALPVTPPEAEPAPGAVAGLVEEPAPDDGVGAPGAVGGEEAPAQ